MAVTRTFSIIKPDATRRNLTGAVTAKLEEASKKMEAASKAMEAAQAKGDNAAAGKAMGTWLASVFTANKRGL